jgi:aminoglycoside 6'-N-acetyltransferase
MYEFRPMTSADLPLVRGWLGEPHVARWWGNPEEQFALVRDDLDHPAMDQFIASHGSRPFAYLQCYGLACWDNGQIDPQPAGTLGIDQFIGEADMLDCGHGSAFIRAFTDRLLAGGTPRVVTDPDPANARAIRAYEKAGFRKRWLLDTPDGCALLMVRNT